MSLSDSTAQKVEKDTRRNEAEKVGKRIKPAKNVGQRIKQILENRRRVKAMPESTSSERQAKGRAYLMEVLGAPEYRNIPRKDEYASGGIIGLQTGGPPTRRSRGYRRRALPQGYAAPQGYAGYGRPGSFTERQEYVAPEVASQWADITQGIMDAGSRSYEDVRYKGPRLAGFTPEEQAYKAAMTRIGTGEGPRATRQAEQTIGEAATGIGSVASRAADANLLADADLSKYESQYTQGVIDPQIRAIREAAKQRAAETGASAAQAGAFGGYRHGLQEQAIAQSEIEQIGDVTAKGYEQAFRSAQEAQQKDAASQRAARAQELGAYGQLGGMGSSQMALGSQMGADEQRRLQMMRDAGMDTRKMQQAAYDIQKAEHEKQMQYPEKQLGWMANMLRNTPYQNITREGTYGPQSGIISTMGAAGSEAASNLAAYQQELNRQGAPPAAPPPIAPPADPTTNLNLPDFSTPTTPPYMPPPPGYDPSLSQANQTQPQPNFMGAYGGGIVGMRNNQIAARLGGGMVPMYYGG